MLPLEEGREIESIKYLNPEFIPELPGFKRSIVDAICTDNYKRTFIVEMQMYWTSAFKQRMLFNAGRAYVRQLKRGDKYRELEPVYGLSLIDDIFLTGEDKKDLFHHHYRIVHSQLEDEIIEGLELVFVELPKFQAKSYADKKLQTLWLRFLTEINEDTTDIPDDLLQNIAIREALECVHRNAFTEEELEYYDNYWDIVRVDKAVIEEERRRRLEAEKQHRGAVNERLEAQRQAEEAVNKRLEAEKHRDEAEKRKVEAEKRKEEAEKHKEEAEKRKEEAEKRKEEAELQLKIAMLYYKDNKSFEEIARLTEKSIEYVKKVLGA